MPNAGTTAGKTALITGVTGQDGAYLAELLTMGYTVFGSLIARQHRLTGEGEPELAP